MADEHDVVQVLLLEQVHDVIDVGRQVGLGRGEVGALAQAALFTNQIPAFKAAPSVYVERAYLQTFVRSTANARKYVLLATNTHDVIIFDLQESIANSLLNLSVPAPKTK